MAKDPQLEVYRWLDAKEVQPPRQPPKVSPMERTMTKKLNQKLLDFIDRL